MMDYYDFQVHLRLCLAGINVDNEFKIMLAGHAPKQGKAAFENRMKNPQRKGGRSKHKIEQEFDPASGEFKDSKKVPIEKIYQRVDMNKGKLL
jgi:hypothetical protein